MSVALPVCFLSLYTNAKGEMERDGKSTGTEENISRKSIFIGAENNIYHCKIIIWGMPQKSLGI